MFSVTKRLELVTEIPSRKRGRIIFARARRHGMLYHVSSILKIHLLRSSATLFSWPCACFFVVALCFSVSVCGVFSDLFLF